MKKICFICLVIFITITPIFATTNSDSKESKICENYMSFRIVPTLESKAFENQPSINYYNEYSLAYSFQFSNKNHGFYMKDTFYRFKGLSLIAMDLGLTYKHKLFDNLNLFTSPYMAISNYNESFEFDNWYLGVGGELALRYKMTNNLQIETGVDAKAFYLIDDYNTSALAINYRYSVNAFIGLTLYLAIEDNGSSSPFNVVYVHLI